MRQGPTIAALLAALSTLSALWAAPADARESRVDYTWFYRVMRPDQAPPLSRPTALAGRRVPLRPTDRVVGLRLGGRARAYPLNVLAYHRVINDRLAGRRVAVAHAPLTGATLCAATAADLFHSGALYENDDLLGDAATGDLWSVMRGQSLLGPRLGQRLPRLPCRVMTWSAWRKLEPGTTVAWSHRPPRGFDYRRDPWAWYRANDEHMAAPMHLMDLRRPRKLEVVGVVHGPSTRAFSLRLKQPPRVINTTVGALPVLVVLHGAAGYGAAFARGGDAFTLARGGRELIDARSQSRWDLLGRCRRGPRRGQQLAPAPGGRALFFAWAALHPGTAIYDETTVAAR